MSKAAKKIAESLNVEKDFNLAPPKDWFKHANKAGFAAEKFVFYRRNGKLDKEHHCRRVLGHCTACGGKDIAISYELAQDNREYYCPACGKGVRFMDWSRYKHWFARHDACGLICFKKSKRKNAGKNIVYTVSFKISWSVNREGEDEVSIQPAEMCVFGYEKAVRFKYESYWGKTGYEYRWGWAKEVKDSWGNSCAYLYPMSEDVLKNTCLENAKLDIWHEYIGVSNTTKYCEQFLLYPGIENLVTNELGSCVYNKIIKNLPRGVINWRETSPCKMLGLNREEQRRFNEEGWDLYKLHRYKWLRDNEIKGSKDNMEILIFINPSEINKSAKRFFVSSKKLFIYLKKQVEKIGGKYNANGMLGTWNDYMDMAVKLEYDTKSEKVLFPPKLRAAHDNSTKAITYAEDEELKVRFKEVYEQLKPLSWQSEQFCIVPAASEQELIHEGKILDHCVGTYGKAHCKDSPIFFIRKAGEPDTPYYTLQLNMKKKTIIQNRGYSNNWQVEVDTQAIAFGELWLSEIVGNYDFNNRIFKKSAKRGRQAAINIKMQPTA